MTANADLGTVQSDDKNLASASSFAVLLYYQYVDVDDEVAAADWMKEICEQQGLLGRVRVSKQGFNVTVRSSEISTFYKSLRSFREG